MSDYTREQQVKDISDRFEQRYPGWYQSIVFDDVDETIEVWVSDRHLQVHYRFQIGSDDDNMIFTNVYSPNDTITVEIPCD